MTPLATQSRAIAQHVATAEWRSSQCIAPHLPMLWTAESVSRTPRRMPSTAFVESAASERRQCRGKLRNTPGGACPPAPVTPEA
eukprot:1779406-Alexandrium_andersonii.AAC.1